MKNNFYIYIHVKPHNGEIFYVGKGKGKRAYSKQRKNTFWKNIVKKYGYDVFILENNLTEQEAFELEEKYIKRVGRRDLKSGTLVNMTDGGEGLAGHIVSEETRRKLSEVHKGRIFSEEWKKKLSEARKGRKISAEQKKTISKLHKGKKLSKEHKKKISESLKGRTLSDETKKKLSEAQKKARTRRKLL